MRVAGGDGTGNDARDDAGPRAGARMLRGAANMGPYQSSGRYSFPLDGKCRTTP